MDQELATIRDRRRGELRPPDPGHHPAVRAYVPTDHAAVTDMAARCSDRTLHRRFHAPVAHLSLDRVTELLTASGAIGVLVAVHGRSVVGVGTLHRRGQSDAEMAVLVEDDWQAGGVGSDLTSALFDLARRHHVDAIVADVLREPRYLVDGLRRHNPAATVTVDGPVATIRMPLVAA